MKIVRTNCDLARILSNIGKPEGGERENARVRSNLHSSSDIVLCPLVGYGRINSFSARDSATEAKVLFSNQNVPFMLNCDQYCRNCSMNYVIIL